MEYKIPVIRKDDFFDSLVDYIEDIPARHEASFKLLNKFIDTNIKSNSDVIIDCPLHNNDRLIELIDSYKTSGAVLKPVLVICTDQMLWADRFNIRKINPLPNQIITDFDEMMVHYERRKIVTKAIDNELVVDSANDISLTMSLIEAYLKPSKQRKILECADIL